MLADFLKTLIQFIEFLWPLKVVRQWESGLYMWCGKIITPWRILAFRLRPLPGVDLGPGIYLTLPFFGDVHAVSLAWDFVESGRFDVTLKDNRQLSCEVVAQMRVVDPRAAWLGFDDYSIDRRKMLRAVASEMLQEAEPERFAPERRGRLLGASLLGAIRSGAEPLGHEVASVRVPTFILGSRTLRLLTEQASAAGI